MMLHLLPFALFALPLIAAADFIPTAPGPGEKFTEGGDCTVEWTADDTGAWKQTNIQLMTGPNNPMIHLTTVGTVDGSDPTKTSFTFPCPKVTKHSAIYFLQFTAQGITNVTWTGRWAIVDATGAVTDPENATQPDGKQIPWGQGQLVDGGSPPPPTAPPGQLDGSKGPVDLPGSLSSSGSSSSSSSSSTSFASPTIATPSTTPSTVQSQSNSGFVTLPAPSPTGSSATRPDNSSSTNTGNNDSSAATFSVSQLVVLTAILLGSFMI